MPQRLPEGGGFRFGRRQFGADQNGIHADLIDLLPRDRQRRVPPQQPEKPGPPQQLQTLNLGRLGVQLQIVCLAQTSPVGKLHDLFGTKLPERHPSPLPVSVLFYGMRGGGA